MAVPDDMYVDEFEDDGTEDTDPSKFHSEMGLCDVRNNMELVNYREDMDKYSEEEKLVLSQKKKAMDIKYDEDEKRNKGKKSRRRTSSEEEFSDPFGLCAQVQALISLSGLSSEHDSDNDNQPMMQQVIFRNSMDSPQGSRSSNRSLFFKFFFNESIISYFQFKFPWTKTFFDRFSPGIRKCS